MKKLMAIITLSSVVIGCGEHNEPAPSPDEKPKESVILPSNMRELEDGVYLVLVSQIEAEVIFTPGTFKIEVAKVTNNKYVELAKSGLAKYTTGKWVEVGIKEEAGRLIYLFKRPTPEDMI